MCTEYCWQDNSEEKKISSSFFLCEYDYLSKSFISYFKK